MNRRPAASAGAGTTSPEVVRREVLVGHDGRSGAQLERVLLADGRRLVVKRSTLAADDAMRASGDADGRERRLWSTGVLDRLPAGVGHAVVDAWYASGEVVTVMRDLGEAVLGWRRVSRAQCRRLFAAAAAVHATFSDGPPVPPACSLANRLGLLTPHRMRQLGDSQLARLVRRGWERFYELAPTDVATAIAELHDDLTPLVTAMAARPATLVHGDLTLVNAALEPTQVTLLDWGLASWAPPALDLMPFLATCWSSVAASREEIIADFRAACGPRDDPVALRWALLAGLVEHGWNKALDITEHPAEAVRVRERQDLEWWLHRARLALATG